MVVVHLVEVGFCLNNDSIDSELNFEISKTCLWGCGTPVLTCTQKLSTERRVSTRALAAREVQYFALKIRYKSGANDLQLIPDNVLVLKQRYLAQILHVLKNPGVCTQLSTR